mmetsp:Transcript_38746/g.91106  ORF Transcript_38746/g.91106 Transcript_38746/m.91106 type:complete len:84 (+) Transcript_38746:46-297(+)
MAITKGDYNFKITGKVGALSAKPMGEAADGMAECKAADMAALEVEIFKAVGEKCGEKVFTFTNSQVTPTASLWTASIGMTYSA